MASLRSVVMRHSSAIASGAPFEATMHPRVRAMAPCVGHDRSFDDSGYFAFEDPVRVTL